jgi:hypothetical protein
MVYLAQDNDGVRVGKFLREICRSDIVTLFTKIKAFRPLAETTQINFCILNQFGVHPWTFLRICDGAVADSYRFFGRD